MAGLPMQKCNREIGCHACLDVLLLIHAQCVQFLREPAKELDRMRKEVVALKQMTEDIINIGGDENGQSN